MSKDELKQFIKIVFGNLDKFSTKGYNDEEEFLDAIFDTFVTLKSYNAEKIKLSDLPDKDKFEATRKEICEKYGIQYKPVSEFSISSVYIIRLYMHAQNRVIFTEFEPEDLKYITLNGEATLKEKSLHNLPFIYSFKFESSNREDIYGDYYNKLPEDKKMEFKQELRKKVIAHEFYHASASTNGLLKYNSNNLSLEEILVERVSLDAANIHRKVLLLRTFKGKSMTQAVPNIESSNNSLYSVGQFLSVLLGEAEMQRARLISKDAFADLVYKKTGLTVDQLKILEVLCVAATSSIKSREYLLQAGFENEIEDLTDNECCVYAQMKLEAILSRLYQNAVAEELKNPKITEQQIRKMYFDYYNIATSVLTYNDPQKKKDMTVFKDLHSAREQIDEKCKQLGYDPDQIRKDVIAELSNRNKHYIHSNISAEQ